MRRIDLITSSPDAGCNTTHPWHDRLGACWLCRPGGLTASPQPSQVRASLGECDRLGRCGLVRRPSLTCVDRLAFCSSSPSRQILRQPRVWVILSMVATGLVLLARWRSWRWPLPSAACLLCGLSCAYVYRRPIIRQVGTNPWSAAVSRPARLPLWPSAALTLSMARTSRMGRASGLRCGGVCRWPARRSSSSSQTWWWGPRGEGPCWRRAWSWGTGAALRCCWHRPTTEWWR